MKRKQTRHSFTADAPESPYHIRESDTMDDFYALWLCDSDRELDLNGRTYYRILSKMKIVKDNSEFVIVHVPNDLHCFLHQNLEDENDNKFTVYNIPMFHYTTPFKDWMRNTYAIVLQGNIDSLGEYLCNPAKIPQNL